MEGSELLLVKVFFAPSFKKIIFRFYFIFVFPLSFQLLRPALTKGSTNWKCIQSGPFRDFLLLLLKVPGKFEGGFRKCVLILRIVGVLNRIFPISDCDLKVVSELIGQKCVCVIHLLFLVLSLEELSKMLF